MEKVITHIDQYGRVFIPSQVRQRFHMKPGDKLGLEILANELKIMSSTHVADQAIDEMHAIFTKHQRNRKGSTVTDFINKKRKEYILEEASIKNGS